jgi:hypothetical protein
MTTDTAASIVDNLSRWGRLSLRIIVDEARGADFATAAARVLGSDFRAAFAAGAGVPMSDAEIRAAMVAHVEREIRAIGGGA